MSKRTHFPICGIIIAGLAVLLSLSAFSQGRLSYLVHTHHHYGEHVHVAHALPDIAQEAGSSPAAHVHAEHHPSIPSGGSELPTKEEPVSAKLVFMELLGCSSFGSTVNDVRSQQPVLVSGAARRLADALISRELPSRLSPSSGAPPPTSTLSRLLLSSHALLL